MNNLNKFPFSNKSETLCSMVGIWLLKVFFSWFGHSLSDFKWNYSPHLCSNPIINRNIIWIENIPVFSVLNAQCSELLSLKFCLQLAQCTFIRTGWKCIDRSETMRDTLCQWLYWWQIFVYGLAFVVKYWFELLFFFDDKILNRIA